ncbi:transposase [Bradyrhizobium sp. CCGUVB23]|uniref:IS66-like element accessory protein TnpA n=1 Tax=Bradyrhizobium sp. CCGUVB23 TaxID=2949630 RepID=UPI0020B41156|nr:transposase [Bradyrhizobium sp. CCGUVB23]MCP3459262.1 transposase [Bradyrhizobium sp. CCGUVB23]MCP3460085.1 transposase [Bradyrhizobium sp. CCGUVB23]MCP3465573.1 transposase [Bradyrhizobium sp. CCGUVB23]
MLDHTLKSDVTARRLEVITETGRRRWFSKDDKARIVEETLVPGAVVSEIARRHGLTPQQVFTWRRQARRLPTPMADDPPFVPAVVDAMVPAVAVGHERKTARRKAKPDVRARPCDAGGIEIEAEGVTIRVGRGADVAMIAAIVHALKASR